MAQHHSQYKLQICIRAFGKSGTGFHLNMVNPKKNHIRVTLRQNIGSVSFNGHVDVAYNSPLKSEGVGLNKLITHVNKMFQLPHGKSVTVNIKYDLNMWILICTRDTLL